MAACVTFLWLAIAAATAPAAGSTGTSTVSASVASVVALDVSGCTTSAATSFGPVNAGTSNMTAPCTVGFASSNDTARLQMVQADRSGTAMSSVADDQLDLTFDGLSGGNGSFSFPIGSGSDIAYDVAAGPDHTIVLTGKAAMTSSDAFVAVLDDDGRPAAGFNGGAGPVTLDVTGTNSSDTALGVAVQPDGRIVIVGEANKGSRRTFLARYLPTGVLDPSFGTGGVVLDDVGGGGWSSGWDIALLPDGRIVVAGYTSPGSLNRFFVARYTPSGARDSSFGSGGVVIDDLGIPGHSEAYRLAVDSQSSIVAVGYAEKYGDGREFAAALRLDATGKRDTSFSSDGIDIWEFGAGESFLFGVAVDDAGNIVAAGGADDGSGGSPAVVVRWHDDGSHDASFGTATASAPLDAQPYDVMVLPDGDVLTVGFDAYGSDANVSIIRLNGSDGTPDADWGTNGVVSLDPGGTDFGRGATIIDGKLVVAGYSTGANADVFVARFDAVQVPDHLSGTNDWTTGPAMFGACLESVGAATDEGAWAREACATNSNTGWHAVPQQPVIIATTSGVGDSGDATLRFGLAVSKAFPPRQLFAAITFEALAP